MCRSRSPFSRRLTARHRQRARGWLQSARPCAWGLPERCRGAIAGIRRRVLSPRPCAYGSRDRSGSSGQSSANSERLDDLRNFQWLVVEVGEALAGYVQPAKQTQRLKIMNALFPSLWCFHKACWEPLDQIATTKFAASMDALTGGGKATGIVQFLSARTGFKPDGKLMTDGGKTTEVINGIYGKGRSPLIYGSRDDFARQSAEVVEGGKHQRDNSANFLRNTYTGQPHGFLSMFYKPGDKSKDLERAKGIEPSSLAWEAKALPLSYARIPGAGGDRSGC